jgi:hypothetical protein
MTIEETIMSSTATATLQTPWDCRWSRFAGTPGAGSNAAAKCFWVCVYGDTAERPICESECETCPNWDFTPPLERLNSGWPAQALEQSHVVVRSLRQSRTRRGLEIGTRVAALALAALLAGTGYVVLTRPLAVPLTISLWVGAALSFVLGIWGRFDRETM